ncbi:HAD family hydrolase [Paenibacillus tepidiphilus]|uniref:HAD family hydrolase n=1 Tax=Paenibacillus tepidiphilus TaxID=2608683 RepID=UPI0013A5707C|nr:HAD family hydrolase [Paenibacillus tepidiphilus]
MRSVGFDLGDTLIYYGGVTGGSFKEHFRSALVQICSALDIAAEAEFLQQGERILSGYNTREHPRDHEVTDTAIFASVLEAWRVDAVKVPVAVKAFFTYFQQTSRAYADTAASLRALKQRGFKVGILTDVPYGMNREFIMRDVAPIREYVDVLVTSVEAGVRKPRPEGYLMLAEKLQSEPQQMMYIGNEAKDIAGAVRAGMTAVLLDRDSARGDWNQRYTISNLLELEDLL